MKKLGYILLLLAAPFFFETGFEMYVLTAFTGPQMLGFALMHGAAGELGLFVLAISALSFALLAIYSLVALCRVLFKKSQQRHDKIYAWIFGLQILHVTLFFLYDYWSPVFSHAN